MRRTLIFLAVLAISGCTKQPTVKHEISACWLDAIRTYANVKPEDQKTLINEYIYVCMRAKDYEFSDIDKPYCKLGRDSTYDFLADTNEACYSEKPVTR